MKRYYYITTISNEKAVEIVLSSDQYIAGEVYHSSWKKSEANGVYRIEENGEMYHAMGTNDFKMVENSNASHRIPRFKYRKLFRLTQEGWEQLMMAIVEENV